MECPASKNDKNIYLKREKAFDILDLNNDGSISKDEALQIGEKVSNNSIEKAFNFIDKNNNNRISLQEWDKDPIPKQILVSSSSSQTEDDDDDDNDCCNNITIKIELADMIEEILKLIFIPVNALIKLLCLGIKFLIKNWNKNINTLSLILERFISIIVLALNGYISQINLVFEEIRTSLRFSLLVLKYNPFVYWSALFLPFYMELFKFFGDTFSLNIIKRIFKDGDFSLLNEFKNAVLNLVLGKTVKPSCNINHYTDQDEMKEHCYEYKLDSCNINISSLWTISLYIIVIIYIAAWLNFLKLFYIDNSDFDLVDYTFLKLGLVSENFIKTFK